MKTVIVEVKQEHIEAGEPGSVCRCPIALALKGAGFADPMVEYSIFFGSHKNRVRVPLLKKTAEFIDRFDCNKPVKPFSFRLRYDS